MQRPTAFDRRHCRIFADGGARGNPGPAAAGGVILAADDSVVAEISEPLGMTTNNVAEYRALILALERALREGCRSAEVLLDSELVVRQLNGEYKVKHPNIGPLYRRVRALLSRFESAIVRHVGRDDNVRADRLVNAALDAQERALKEATS